MKRVTLDLNAISFEKWMKFEGARTAQAWAIAGLAVTDWDYDVPVADGLRALPTANDANYVVGRLAKTMGERVDELGSDGVDVEMNLTPDEWINFQSDLTAGNWRSVERVLQQVATIRGVDKEQPLTALQGLRMLNAVRQRYQDAMSGNF